MWKYVAEDYWLLIREAQSILLPNASTLKQILRRGVSSIPIGACPINIFAVRATLERLYLNWFASQWAGFNICL